MKIVEEKLAEAVCGKDALVPDPLDGHPGEGKHSAGRLPFSAIS